MNATRRSKPKKPKPEARVLAEATFAAWAPFVTRRAFNPLRPRGTRTPFATALQQHCHCVYAWKDQIDRRMRKDTYVTKANAGGGTEFLWTRSVPLYAINDHEDGRPGLKVSNRHGGVCLIYVDPDAFEGDPESLADCRKMMSIVRADFPEMTEDPVFNQRGGSGWIRVDSEGTTDKEFNALIDRLEKHYRWLADAMGLRLKVMELHGRVYEHVWSQDDRGTLCAVKCGDLLKAPPSIEYLQQPVVQASYFNDPKFDEIELQVVEAEQGKRKRTGGSFHAKLVSDQMQVRIGILESRCRNWFPDRPQRVGRRAISSRAFAELVLTFCLLKVNQDGSNPGKRHQKFVEALYAAGVFEYAWNPNVCQAVRDYLTGKGQIDWKDNRYWKGRACRWKVDQQLVERVLVVVEPQPKEQEEEQGPSAHDLVYHLPDGPHQHMTPSRVWSPPIYPEWYKGGPPSLYPEFQLAA